MSTTLAPPTASPAPRPLAVPVLDPATGAQHFMREDWLLDGIVNAETRRAFCGTDMVAQTSGAPARECPVYALILRAHLAGAR